MISNPVYPVMDTQRELVRFTSFWTAPSSAGDLVKVFGTGVVSCVRTAAGKYTLQLAAPYPNATLWSAKVYAGGVTGVQPLIGAGILSTYSTSAGTLSLEIFNADATDTLADPVSGTWPKVEIELAFIGSTL